MLITFNYKLSIDLTMALVISSISQLTLVRTCERSIVYCRIFLVLHIVQSVHTKLKDGKNDIMGSVQRYHCCELALGLYGVRRRTGTISNCEHFFEKREAKGSW